LLDIQHSYRSALRRVGLTEKLDKALESGSFLNEEEALKFALLGEVLIDQEGKPLDEAQVAEIETDSDQNYDEVIAP
jgi:hypothetical protein